VNGWKPAAGAGVTFAVHHGFAVPMTGAGLGTPINSGWRFAEAPEAGAVLAP
jgi:hypothetical protein